MDTYNLAILKAVADETRLKMLIELKKNEEKCACELPGKVKKTQPAVSQHLKILLKAGLTKVEKKGTMRIYSLSTKGKKIMENISKW